MKPLRKTVCCALVGGLVALTCGTTAAQTTLVDAFLGPPSVHTARQQWQQRVLRSGGGVAGPVGQVGASYQVDPDYQPATSGSNSQAAPAPFRTVGQYGYRTAATSPPYASYQTNSQISGAMADGTVGSGQIGSPEPMLTPEPMGTSYDQGGWDAGAEYPMADGFGDGGWSDDGGWYGGYDQWGYGYHGPLGLAGWRWWRGLSMFAGVHGFKGPADLGCNGNFGFHEGVNYGMPLGLPWPIGIQGGFQAVHSNFEGNQVTRRLEETDRNQVFVTVGVFRRAPYGGFQWVAAVDYLHDSYYVTTDVTRIRSETGYVFSGGREIGFWGGYNTGGDRISVDQVSLKFEPDDMFAFYYRRYFLNGGEGRFWGGWTGNGDGMIGADLLVPLGRSWALENSFNYIIPGGDTELGSQAEEAWNVAINLVWYPGRSAQAEGNDPFRPLLGVADNGLFVVRTQPD